jgi:stage II sporulation protein E
MESFFARLTGDSSAASCAVRFFLAAVLSGSQLHGGCAPFALGLVAAAGAGMQGLSALLGLLVGSLLFMEMGAALKYIAIGVLVFSVSVAFYDTRIYRKLSFMPAVCAMCTAAVGFVYLMSASPTSSDAAFFALETALAAACAFCARVVFDRGDADDRLFRACFGALAVFVLIAASAVPLTQYMSLGRVLTCALTLYFAFAFGSGAGAAAGLTGGLAMDAAVYGGGDGGLFYCAAYAIGALCASLAPKRNRLLSALLFAAGSAVPMIFSSGAGLAWSVPEAAVGCVIFMLLPRGAFSDARVEKNTLPTDNAAANGDGPAGSAEPETLRRRLLSAADAFRALYDDLSRSAAPANDENIATVFDRAADSVCRRCAIRAICWEKDYVSTYNALNDAAPALTERGRLLPADLPTHFTSRCINLTQFMAAVDSEFSAMLMRRQYGKQLDETRRQAKRQYAEISEFLTSAAREGADAAAALAEEASGARIGAASEPKNGESVSGDTLASFEANGKIFLMLSDGMGCGEAARRESAMTVRLMERFLKSGIEPETALRTLNSAMTLHSDESGSFTTIDLLSFSPRTGAAVLYKYGAAPTYIAHGAAVRRISGSTLPAGLSEAGRGAEKTELHLLNGDTAVLVSDGTVDADDDGWLKKLLAEEAAPPQETAEKIVRESRERTGRSDDGSAIVLRVAGNEEKI